MNKRMLSALRRRWLLPWGRSLSLAALVWSCALPAPADEAKAEAKSTDLTELPLEALMELEVPKVYGASKLEQKTTEAPSSVTVLTSEDIKRYGYRTLAELLQSVQGLQVSYDRNYAFLGSRGVNLGDFNSRVLLLVDGHRINNNLTDGAYIDTAFILDIDLIDRVEIIRGPGSVLYGNNAFFGVINVITRQGKQVNGAEVSGEYGEFDSYRGRASYGRVFTNGLQMLFSGSYYDSAGAPRLFYKEFNSPALNDGVAENLDGDQVGSFFGSLSFRDVTLQGAYNRREKDNPTAQYVGATSFNQPGLTTIDERSYVALKAAHSFPDILDFTAQIYYDRSDFNIGYPTTIGVYQEKDSGEWWGGELQLTKRVWDRHVFTLGAEYRNDFQQEYTLSAPSGGGVISRINRDRESHGVYFQGDIGVLTNLHVNGGVRYDQYGSFDPSFNPRVAVIYSPIKTSTFKAIYGTAFRTPNFLELALATTTTLEPENITSYELVYEQEIGRHLRSSLSGFYNEMEDLIVFQNGSFDNFNANTRGVELALEGSWTNGMRGRASYSFQDTERADGSDMTDSPAHLLKFNVSVPVYRDKVFAGLEVQYTSSRHTTFPISTTTVAGSDTAGFGIVNFTLFSQNLVKNLEFSASIYNLLDTHYSDPSTRLHLQDMIERDGRTFRFKLTYHF